MRKDLITTTTTQNDKAAVWCQDQKMKHKGIGNCETEKPQTLVETLDYTTWALKHVLFVPDWTQSSYNLWWRKTKVIS